MNEGQDNERTDCDTQQIKVQTLSGLPELATVGASQPAGRNTAGLRSLKPSSPRYYSLLTLLLFPSFSGKPARARLSTANCLTWQVELRPDHKTDRGNRVLHAHNDFQLQWHSCSRAKGVFRLAA